MCHTSTAATVNAVRALVSSGGVEASLCCAVVDKKLGHDALREIITDHQIVCSAIIHDEILRTVRTWTRQGHSSESIQETLDCMYGDYYRNRTADRVAFEGDEHTLPDSV